jgi:hypothetical protein
MKTIGQMLPAVLTELQTGSRVPATQELKQLKTSEESRFEMALQEEKLLKVSFDEFKQTLKYCILLVGLRAQNFPSDEEKEFLYQYTKQHYGMHTLPEIRLAFDMAIQGKLNLDADNVKCYENFSVQYFSSILNAYRSWAAQVHDQLKRTSVPAIDHKPLSIDWRELIEKEYQGFVTSGVCAWTTWPAEFYDQAVEDGFIAAAVYREQMKEAKQALCGELQRKIAIAQMGSAEEIEKYVNIRNLENRLIEYRNGSRDAEVILVAKQYCVLMLFASAKHHDYKNLYIQE